MTQTTDRPTVTISLEFDCTDACLNMARPLYRQMNSGAYRWPMSVLELDGLDYNSYLLEHGTAHKRATKALALGYGFGALDRHSYRGDIYDINTSMPERQGRPMSESYLRMPEYTPLEQDCDRHRINCYGVFDRNDTLRAYSFVYRAGDLALVSQILGHGDHLNHGVMFLLGTSIVQAELDQGGYLVYNRHDSGGDGLKWHKERIGFQPRHIEWAR